MDVRLEYERQDVAKIKEDQAKRLARYQGSLGGQKEKKQDERDGR